MSGAFDVIVIGVGAMGSSACMHLARRGQCVLGLEQFGIPNAMGSSHGESRMIRLCYYEHPDYVPLLLRAYELWEELERLSGQQLLHITGGIYMGAPSPGRDPSSRGGAFIAGTLEAATRHSLPHEQLTRSELARRFPQFHVPDDYIGVFEPRAGFLLPERVIAAAACLALEHGAELHGHEPVESWTTRPEGVEVRTARCTYRASRLIVCAGGWTSSLLARLPLRLVVTRQVLGWVAPRAGKAPLFALGTMPVWAIEHPDATIHYGFPIIPGRPGFKIAHHFKGEPTTVQAIDRLAGPADEQDFRPILARYIPDADGPLLSMAVCMYTNTDDSHFVIDRFPHDAHGRVTIACGFSGHGFKFASVVGEILADLAIDGRTRHPIGFLGADRFVRTATGVAR